jgi:hypothetical protein
MLISLRITQDAFILKKAKTEKSKRGKALSESGMVRADAACLLKIPPELLTERGSIIRQ